jgi:BASS family bile acid:Na+ symporter
MHEIDLVKLHFEPNVLLILNIILGFVLFGISLELKIEDFKNIFAMPKSIFVGLISHTILLPLLTFMLVIILKPHPSLALGMILVAACPGGHMANFMTHNAKGNTALSVSISALSTLLAAFLTPFNFQFWGSKVPYLQDIMKQFDLSFVEMMQTVLILVVLPLIIGLFTAVRFPNFTNKIKKPIKILSLLFFFGFIVLAIFANFNAFRGYLLLVGGLVILHNSLALLSGFLFGKMCGLPYPDQKTMAFEMGIQNTGLGLILIFNFFDGLGGMAMIAAIWGIWHFISGFGLSYYFSKH